MSYLSRVKSYYKKKSFFTTTFNFCSLEAKPLILGEIRGFGTERALEEVSNALFRCAVALLVPELCDGWSKNVEIYDI